MKLAFACRVEDDHSTRTHDTQRCILLKESRRRAQCPGNGIALLSLLVLMSYTDGPSHVSCPEK